MRNSGHVDSRIDENMAGNKFLQSMVVVLESLYILSDARWQGQASSRTDIRKMIIGECDDSWTVISDALDAETEYWGPLKSEFRKKHMFELTGLPTVKKLVAEIAKGPNLQRAGAIATELANLQKISQAGPGR